MGLLSGLFGGGTPKKTTTTNVSAPWKEQVPYLTGQAVTHVAPQPSDLWLNALRSIGQGYVRPVPEMTANSISGIDPYGQMLAGGVPISPLATPMAPVQPTTQFGVSNRDLTAAKAWQDYNQARRELQDVQLNRGQYLDPEYQGVRGRTLAWRNAANKLSQATDFLKNQGLIPENASDREISQMGLNKGNMEQPVNQFGQPQSAAQPVSTMPVAGTQPVRINMEPQSGYPGAIPATVSEGVTPGLFPSAGAWFSGAGEQYFPGPTVAGFTPGQEFGNVAQTLAGLQQLETAQALQPQLEKMYGQTTGALGNILGARGVPTNPYTGEAMRNYADEAIEALRDVRLPSIAREALSRGTYGSARQGLAEAEALGQTQEAISKAATGLAHADYGNYLNALQNQQQLQAQVAQATPTIFGQYSQARNMPAEALSQLGAITGGIGQEYQNLGQRILGGEQERFNFYQQQPYNMLQRYGQLIGGNYGGASSETAPQPRTNALAAALGGASAGWALGAGPGALIGGALGLLGR